MDVSEPATVLASGLTMPVLEVLSQRSSPATAAQIFRAASSGTEAGLRRALDRLARHGVVSSEQIGDRTVYTLNDEHVLFSAVQALRRADEVLVKRLRKEIAGWELEPFGAALYGSAARKDGDADSDIDVLLIRPRLVNAQQRELWASQVRRLREQVKRWTGNYCQVMDRTSASFESLRRDGERIVDEWREDAIDLGRGEIRRLLS